MDASNSAALLGEIKAFHSFNGTIAIPRGWMQCDGSVVGSTAYDAIHGSGAYTSDGLSALLLHGKYTPNLTNRYLIGAATTTASGSSPIGTTGNSSHQINLNHDHSHSHVWQKYVGDSSHSTDGQNAALTVETGSGGYGILIGDKGSGVHVGGNPQTDTNSAANLSSTQSIKPESIEVIYIIRVGL
jgi:microcystin-dependent protein